MQEIWKDINGYEGLYQISNYGRVINIRTNRLLKPNISISKKRKSGYVMITLYKKNVNRKSFSIHTLVWDHFGDKPRDGRKLQVDHIDENKLNNRIDNLNLLSNRENKSRSCNKKTSKYTGVFPYKNTNNWRVCLYINGSHKYLGIYKTEEEARDVYVNFIKNNNKINVN